jgi:hypothetical protein
MVLLNLSSRLKRQQLQNNCKTLFVLLSITSALQAEVIPFFNPTQIYQPNAATINIQGFIASDPVSLKGFFNDWEGDYTPRNGDNIAMEEFRLDIGTVIYDSYYVGYFYTRNLLAATNRGFVDFYHAIKNDTQFSHTQNYNLKLDMKGIEEHGVMLSRNYPLIDSDEHRLIIGVSAYLSYATDTQDGMLLGESSIGTNGTYNASGITDYYYQDNLLYDLVTEKTYGIGYGLHLGAMYVNKRYNFDIEVTINNVLARSYWSNLPFSHVDIESRNQIINDKGHVEYEPTISGLEVYRDYIQKIIPKYHMDITKHFPQEIDVTVGIDTVDSVTIPYVTVSKMLNDTQKVELLYETKFNSRGISFEGRNYGLSIMIDGFSSASTVSFSGSYIYHF